VIELLGSKVMPGPEKAAPLTVKFNIPVIAFGP